METAEALKHWYHANLHGKPKDRKTGVIHASDLTYLPGRNKCFMRILGYWARGAQPFENIYFKQRMVFDIGHGTHDVVQGLMKGMFGDAIEVEKRVALDSCGVTGRVDGVVQALRRVYEIKSSTDGAVEKYHRDQANLYAYLLVLAGIPIETFEVIIAVKSNGALISEPNQVDPGGAKRFLEIADVVWSRREGPLADRVVTGYGCASCSFYQECDPRKRPIRRGWRQ